MHTHDLLIEMGGGSTGGAFAAKMGVGIPFRRFAMFSSTALTRVRTPAPTALSENMTDR